MSESRETPPRRQCPRCNGRGRVAVERCNCGGVGLPSLIAYGPSSPPPRLTRANGERPRISSATGRTSSIRNWRRPRLTRRPYGKRLTKIETLARLEQFERLIDHPEHTDVQRLLALAEAVAVLRRDRKQAEAQLAEVRAEMEEAQRLLAEARLKGIAR